MDNRFRSAQLANEFMEHASKTGLIVDLGCGTGANYQYLSRRKEAELPWRCVDRDGDALKIAAGRLPSDSVQFEMADLATDFTWIPANGDCAITASAFLDLTSKDWLGRFAELVTRIPILISMTASGPPVWHPVDDVDEAIESCLESHRNRDHGFGPAAGLSATRCLAEKLTARNCHVSWKASDWCVDYRDDEVLAALIDGFRRRALAKLPRGQVETWAKKRQQQTRAGILKLTLPHMDLMSLPQQASFHERMGET